MARGRLIAASVKEGRARVKGQPRRAVNMLTYLIQHAAHDRGSGTASARAGIIESREQERARSGQGISER